MECMSKDKDFPKFMKYTHKIPVTKNGKDRPYEEIKKDRNRVAKRIDNDIVCPMNWMQERLEKIQGASTSGGTDVCMYLIEKPKKSPTHSQMKKIRSIVEDYDSYCRHFISVSDCSDEEGLESMELIENKSQEVFEIVRNMKPTLATMYRLIESSLGYEGKVNTSKIYKNATKYTVKTLNILYRANREMFLSCFMQESR